MAGFASRLAAVALAACLAGPAAGQEAVPPGDVAFFGLTFINSEGDPDIADEMARIDLVEELIAADLESRGFTLLDLTPLQVRLDGIKNPAKCNGCDMTMAQEIGARYSIAGEVQKVSNLILSMNLFVRDVEARSNLRHGAVDIRGNTDESWTRGYRYLLKNIIFREEKPE